MMQRRRWGQRQQTATTAAMAAAAAAARTSTIYLCSPLVVCDSMIGVYQVLKHYLQSLYMAVSADEAAPPTVLQQLMGQLRKLTNNRSVAAMLAATAETVINSPQQCH